MRLLPAGVSGTAHPGPGQDAGLLSILTTPPPIRGWPENLHGRLGGARRAPAEGGLGDTRLALCVAVRGLPCQQVATPPCRHTPHSGTLPGLAYSSGRQHAAHL